MASIMAVFGATLQSGDVLVIPSDSYYTSRLLGISQPTEKKSYSVFANLIKKVLVQNPMKEK